MDDPMIVKTVVKAAKLHERGNICPAVMWEAIARTLIGHDVTAILNQVEPEFQAVLRRVYHERSLSIRYNMYETVVLDAIESWCLSEN